MSRKKPYRKRVMLLDITLTILTSGLWLLYVAFREYRAQSGN